MFSCVYRDSGSMALLEALARGCRIVCLDIPSQEWLPEQFCHKVAVQPTSSAMEDALASALQQEIAALKKALADQTVPSPTETVRMRRELAEIAAQRDSAANELRKIKRSQALADLAAGQYFNDAEYLDFILQKNNGVR